MYSTRTCTSTRALASKQSAVQLSRAVCTYATSHHLPNHSTRASGAITQHRISQTRRNFSTSPRTQIKDYFPEPDAPTIKTTPAAWAHPVYTNDQLNDVVIAHRQSKTMSDKVALTMVKLLRFFLDRATGYKHDKAVALAQKSPKEANQKYAMNERKYMIRNVFLGKCGGRARHGCWIETLLEESYNERMHLLTFLRMAEPGPIMRIMVLGAQGVFFNAFFVAYLLSPRTCHRFVGHLEEEAVLTYTREIADIDAGRLPKWENKQAPDIAVKYWKMPEGRRMIRDLLLYIRADEAKHREVNHTLGNLDQKVDPNPYVSLYKDEKLPHPTKGLEYLRPTGWERKEVIGRNGL